MDVWLTQFRRLIVCAQLLRSDRRLVSLVQPLESWHRRKFTYTPLTTSWRGISCIYLNYSCNVASLFIILPYVFIFRSA